MKKTYTAPRAEKLSFDFRENVVASWPERTPEVTPTPPPVTPTPSMPPIPTPTPPAPPPDWP